MTNDHLHWLQQIGNCPNCQHPIIRNPANDLSHLTQDIKLSMLLPLPRNGRAAGPRNPARKSHQTMMNIPQMDPATVNTIKEGIVCFGITMILSWFLLKEAVESQIRRQLP